mgnify:CR=1 FL=1
MLNKLHQITDTVHQTIYISEAEYRLISTPYFFRLHDVYQSSTVYLTFPSNRTKRYEHSCGTMAIAGEMFFSAITNADADVLDSFFDEVEHLFDTMINRLLKNSEARSYCHSSFGELAKCFPSTIYKKNGNGAVNLINEIYDNRDKIKDQALSHYIPPFIMDDVAKIRKRCFLYQCVLEAVRIVALFHDVGHPPFSHIMEKVLNEIYNECKQDLSSEQTHIFNAERAQEVISNLSQFKESNDDKIKCFLSNSTNPKDAIHEQIGLKMMSAAFDELFMTIVAGFKKQNETQKAKYTIVSYYIMVAELCFGILREENALFKSLHRIIDGCIDADRMDYVVRDSINSGVDWGRIPYKRLLESCKLFSKDITNEKYYIIAYPRKMADNIDDILTTRYKIFSRINYHHNSYKTATILQQIVKMIALDYLRKGENSHELCAEISDLWNCLSNTLNSQDLNIIQWNDSTLLTHLYQTLNNIKTNDADYFELSEEQYSTICHMLEEFILNKKYYYSIFKRQIDFKPILANIFARLQPSLDKIIKHEKEKNLFSSNCDTAYDDAKDSLNRLNLDKLLHTIETGDIDVLTKLFWGEETVPIIICNVLEDFKEKKKIGSYVFDKNTNYSKTGLPKGDDESKAVYLYSSKTMMKYDTTILEESLVKLQLNCLEYIASVELDELDEELIAEIKAEIEIELYEKTEEILNDLFPNYNDYK